MITVLSDFDTRVKEIDEYYKLLNTIINEGAKLYYPSKQTHKTKLVDEELIKVMKANCFLLLYNLIESSVKSSITEIYDAITNECVKYEDVTDNIRRLWIREKYDNFNDKKNDFVFNSIENIANDSIQIFFNSDRSISGNLDGRKIRQFSAEYGFSNNTHHKAKNGEKLHLVKTQRNNLAHGSISFSECGRQYTYDDLNQTKKQVYIYLRGILKNIEKYIGQRHFKK